MGPTGNTRVVQIHPTRTCNLSCKHCYSSSSPQATETLEPELLEQALDDLALQGYNWISFSGGEPLVYDPLARLMEHARSHHMQTSLVSNGMLLTGSRLDAIAPVTDALVISLDGKPESHNRMRNSPRAFQTMQKNLKALHAHGINFGFLFTLTQYNLDELPWVVEFCIESGAGGLLIHPLEITGNASSQMSDESPDKLESAHAWVLVERLKVKYRDQLNIRLDLVHTSAFEHQPDQFFLGDYSYPLQGQLASLMSVLVIEPDGEVVPLTYGFPREYSLGNLKELRISEMVDRWQRHTGPSLHRLSTDMAASLAEPPGGRCNGRFINWYEKLNQFARHNRAVSLTVPRVVGHTSMAGVA